MKRHWLAGFCSVFCGAALSAAMPQVDESEVSISQDQATRLLTVSYVLRGAPAVVTVDFLTNATGTAQGPWCSIGEGNFTNVQGTVNRAVSELGVTNTITWRPDESWPKRTITGGNFRAKITAWPLNSTPDYMAVDLSCANKVLYYVSEAAVPGGVTNRMYKTEMLLMRRIHAADVEWRMGCIPGDEGVKRSAAMLKTEASRLVRLTKDYYIGIYELTQRQWTLLGSTETETIANPSRYQDTSLYAGDPLVKPVEKFTYITLRGKSTNAWKGWPECGHDVAEGSFLQKARLKTGILFDAPTDAQWEFACRAGTTTVLNNGKDIKSNYDAAGVGCPEYDEVAWHSKNSFLTNEHGVYTNQTHEVGTKRPNDWGLYDMHGNIFEWCLDWVTDSVSNGSLEVQVDPAGLLRGVSSKRHIRGGSCQHFVNNGRTSSKMLAGEGWGDYVGVRLTAPVGGEW